MNKNGLPNWKGIYLVSQNSATDFLQDSWYLVLDLNLGPAEYEDREVAT
jgi:hypothetical protein